MGKRKQYLVSRIISRIRHLMPVGEEGYLKSFRAKLQTHGARILSRWLRQLDKLFNEWDQGVNSFEELLKVHRMVYARH